MKLTTTISSWLNKFLDPETEEGRSRLNYIRQLYSQLDSGAGTPDSTGADISCHYCNPTESKKK